jgi:hypothetical protein
MSFDDQIVKQKKIITLLKENPQLKQEELRDYAQEFFRADRILHHHLRGYNNPAGRYLGMAAFTVGGISLVLLRKPVNGYFRSLRPEDLAIVGASAILGYLYAGRYHGNNQEYRRLLNIYNEQSRPLNEEFNKIFDKL